MKNAMKKLLTTSVITIGIISLGIAIYALCPLADTQEDPRVENWPIKRMCRSFPIYGAQIEGAPSGSLEGIGKTEVCLDEYIGLTESETRDKTTILPSFIYLDKFLGITGMEVTPSFWLYMEHEAAVGACFDIYENHEASCIGKVLKRNTYDEPDDKRSE
jgi:hypothetical protein